MATASRRGFLLGAGGLIGSALLGGCTGASTRPTTGATAPSGSSAAASTSGDLARPIRVAYCMLLHGSEYRGPTSAGGAPDLSVLDAIAARALGAAVPSYVKLGQTSGSGSQIPDRGSGGLEAGQKLMSAGAKLGLRIDLAPKGHGNPSVSDLVAQAEQIRRDGDAVGGFYDWLFLDHAAGRIGSGGGTDDLQQVVDGLVAAGWPRVMINASNFNVKEYPKLPQRTWAMAKHFSIFSSGSDWRSTVDQVVKTGAGAVTSKDMQFVDYVKDNRPQSTALLKLEIPSETQRFEQLGEGDQSTLLRLWSQAESRYGFRQIYPLFLSGPAAHGGRTTGGYDSYSVGTLDEQRALMDQYG